YHESAPETCSHCEQALGSFFDRRCPKCCGLEPRLDSTNWMISAYNSVLNALDFITGTKPAGAEGYTAMPSRSDAHSVPSPLREFPSTSNTSLPQHRTPCPATTEEMFPPIAALPAPHLLCHRRRASQVGDVFKTHLPGEMPCSPTAR
ncbi:unnamed protein product, partial [Symbiodinium microadriaticum]